MSQMRKWVLPKNNKEKSFILKIRTFLHFPRNQTDITQKLRSLTGTQILKPQPFYSEHDLSVIFLKMPFFYFFCGKRNKNSNPYVMINDYYRIQIMRARERGFVELKGFRRKHGEACRNI